MSDIPASLKDWSVTEASNEPAGTRAIGNLDNNLRRIQVVVRELASSTTLASAATTDLGSVDESYVTVSGTTTITSLGSVSAGINRWVVFSGALTLTHNGTSLILPAGANISTQAGDCAHFVSLGSGNWRCLAYQPATGIPTGVPALSAGRFLTNNGTALQWADPTINVAVSPKSSTYTVVAADRGSLISCTGTFTLTLTAAGTLGAGWTCYVENAGTGAITLTSTSDIDGLSADWVMYPGEQRLFVSTGTAFETVLLCGGRYRQTAVGNGTFIAPPGVQRFMVRAIAAGDRGTGNGSVAGDGGRGGAGAEFSLSLTAGTSYTTVVGDGASSSAGNKPSGISGVLTVSEAALSSFAGAASIYRGGAGGTGGAAGATSIFGGGGGGGGNSGAGGASFFAGAGGAAGSPGVTPGGGGGGGTSLGVLGQDGGNGLLEIWW